MLLLVLINFKSAHLIITENNSLLCNSKSFQIVNDEYRQGIKSDFSITVTDDAYTAKLVNFKRYQCSTKLVALTAAHLPLPLLTLVVNFIVAFYTMFVRYIYVLVSN